MASERPHISKFRKRRLFEFRVYVETVFRGVVSAVKQLIYLSGVEPGQRYVKIRAL